MNNGKMAVIERYRKKFHKFLEPYHVSARDEAKMFKEEILDRVHLQNNAFKSHFTVKKCKEYVAKLYDLYLTELEDEED